MQELWRYYSYYLFGLLPSLFFGLRFLIQWLASEKKRESHVNKTFWYLSLCGNTLCCIHYFIQLQFLLMLIQYSNGFIAWRNLNLFSQKKIPLKSAIHFLLIAVVLISLLFFSQFFFIPFSLHLPFALWQGAKEISFFWHLLGGTGCIIFASRFWFQWIEAEKTGSSKLSQNFWWISIFGSSIALLYFVHMGDWVSSLNYSFGLLPYIRNLMLQKKKLSRKGELEKN